MTLLDPFRQRLPGRRKCVRNHPWFIVPKTRKIIGSSSDRAMLAMIETEWSLQVIAHNIPLWSMRTKNSEAQDFSRIRPSHLIG
jgi:hypothetical protein